MTSKQNIMFHFDAVNIQALVFISGVQTVPRLPACDSHQYDHALGLFNRIQDPSAVIIFNIASCHLHSGNIQQAIQHFQKCLQKDSYMVAGHFQLAVCYVLHGDTQNAMQTFEKALTSFRVNEFVDYKQLHMSARIYAAEVHYNLALLHLFSTDVESADSSLRKALSLTMPANRKVMVEDALSHLQMEDWEYFGESALERLIRLPDDALFRPNKSKLEGIQSSTTNFKAPAQVLSASKEEYSFVGFVGAAKLQSATGRPSRPSPPNTPPNIPPPRLPNNQFQPIRPSKDRSGSPKMHPTRPAPAKPGPKPVLTPNTNSPQHKKPPRPVSPAPTYPHSTPPRSKPPVPVLQQKKETKVNVSCDFSLTIDNDTTYEQLLTAIEDKIKTSLKQQKLHVKNNNKPSVVLTNENWLNIRKSSDNVNIQL